MEPLCLEALYYQKNRFRRLRLPTKGVPQPNWADFQSGLY